MGWPDAIFCSVVFVCMTGISVTLIWAIDRRER